MDAELVTLASAAATTLVHALATDGWGQVKKAIAALWERVHPDRASTVAAELAETRSGVLAAREVGDDRALQDLVAEWQGRLMRLLVAEPGLATELRHITDELSRALPPAELGVLCCSTIPLWGIVLPTSGEHEAWVQRDGFAA